MLKNKKKFMVFVYILCLSMGLPACKHHAALVVEETTTEEKPEESLKKGEMSDTEESIVVYVCGQVKCPGVYTLRPGARKAEAIQMAGGFTKNACQEQMNLAEKVVDEEQIVVLSKKEAEDQKAGEIEAKAEQDNREDTRVNINTADISVLQTLPGIGESKAERIIEYREQNGAFQTIEDIMKVDGIKEGSYEKIKDLIRTQ